MTLSKQDVKRWRYLSIFILIVLAFVVVTTQEFLRAVIIQTTLMLIAVVLIKKGSNFLAIDSNYKTDIFVGVVVGVVFIGLVLSGLNIVTPTSAQSIDDTNGVAIDTVGASIVEESFFRGVVMPYLSSVIPNLFVVVLQAVIFASFHIVAYGSVDTMLGAFVGSFIFGSVAGFTAYKTKSLISVMIAHFILNSFIIFSKFVAISSQSVVLT